MSLRSASVSGKVPTSQGLLPGIVILTLALCGASEGQGQPDLQKPLRYDISVTLKLVQVYVTAKGGQPASDLKADEFEVSDNGRTVAVTHFEKHFLGEPEESSGLPSPGPRMSRKFFLLFDFGFMDAHGVLKAKNAGLHFLDTKVQPADEVGLLTYTALRGLVLHEYLTTDHMKIRRIVDGFGLKRLTGRAENLSDYIFTVDLQERPPRAGTDEASGEDFFQQQAKFQTGREVDDGTRQSYVERARHFVMSLDNFARVIRYIPGTKNVILFSGGLSRQVLYGKKGGAGPVSGSTVDQLAAQMRSYDAAQADTGLRWDFTAMLEQFKASNSPVYALDVSRGQKGSDISDIEGSSAIAEELEGADSLRQFASGTGGRFFANTVDYRKSLDSIQNVTGAYYVLGYSVNEKWDGKFHKIKVRVTRKGCEVLAQGGYFSPKPYTEYSSFEKLLHVTDLALSENPQFQVPEEVPVAAMAVTVRGSPELVAFARASSTAQADVLGGKSEAYLLLLDENGDIALIKRFKLTLPEDKAGKETFFPTFLLSVKPGRFTCRLVLRNMETGRGARGSAALVIPGASAGPIVLDPPLLLTLDPRSKDLAASEAGSLSSLFSYDPDSYAPLVGDVPTGLAKVFAAVRCSADVPDADFDFSASLAGAASQARADLPVSVLKRSRDGRTVLTLLELGTGELRPGSYNLQVVAKAKGGPSTSSATVEFVVR
jgi:VWFA-related protein